MYGFTIQVTTDFEQTIKNVTAALAEQSFGVITEIDLQAKFKEKLGIDYTPYRILGACNPSFAHKAIEQEADIGLLLPCNVVVRAIENGCVVAFLDPASMFSLVDNDAVAPMANEVKAMLERARDSLVE